MDDIIFISILVYLVLSIGIIAFVPDAFFTGSAPSQLDVNGDDSGGISAIGKIGRFLFAGWTINGIPAIFGLLLFILNVVSIVVGIVYIYDKIRGI